MRFVETPLRGAFEIELERHSDERGSFARMFCAEEFAEHGLDPRVAQTSLSRNPRVATLRGMHFQVAPYGEVKVVRCVRGEIFDVIVDLRDTSATRRRWHGVELSAERGNALYIPEGFAHGFVTLTPDCDVEYQISMPYQPSAARGVRWNDPLLAIEWPLVPALISERDANYPLLT